MSSSAHAVALRRQHAQQSRLKWTVLVPLALAGSITAAHGQANPPAPATPPGGQPTAPAEIQPGHPADGTPATSGSGSQTAVPAPLPPSAGADTPGGSARNGVIRPPPVAGDTGMTSGAPPVGTMPVIPPPGTAGGNQRVVPK